MGVGGWLGVMLLLCSQWDAPAARRQTIRRFHLAARQSQKFQGCQVKRFTVVFQSVAEGENAVEIVDDIRRRRGDGEVCVTKLAVG